jgi:hypothetical protein
VSEPRPTVQAPSLTRRPMRRIPHRGFWPPRGGEGMSRASCQLMGVSSRTTRPPERGSERGGSGDGNEGVRGGERLGGASGRRVARGVGGTGNLPCSSLHRRSTPGPADEALVRALGSQGEPFWLLPNEGCN